MRWITERWPILVTLIAVFIVIGLIYITADGRRELSPLEGKVRDGLAPLYGAFSGITGFANHWWGVISNYSRLQKENGELVEEIEWMKHKLAMVEQLEQENASLRESLGFARSITEPPAAAEVIARSPSNWFDKLVINRGEKDGLEAGDAVVTSAGVVGRIFATTKDTSEVMLITDDRSAFGATVLRSGDPVVVEGGGQWNSLRLKPLIKEVDLQVGDQIITSSMSGIYPNGLPVGTIISMDTGEYGLLVTAVIKPHADLARLRRVFVLKMKQ
ncbi:MAG: rod shape-determining protein MreC [Firmicutes bacterium]|jgi:rod shape-determining protein MreC|nr:rod shape-determining protein MreC [Bacillota bacterium]